MEETKENLEKMNGYGISEGISEIILTTRNTIENPPEKYNAAPIGIIWKNDKMFLHLFTGTKTCRNLTTEKYFAANMTDDAVLYTLSTFYDLKEENFSTVSIEAENSVEMIPVLKNASRFVIFKCLSQKASDDIMIIEIEPVLFRKMNAENESLLINRGFNSVIEACVHMTRYEKTKDPLFIDLIRHHFSLIQRCGRKRDKEGLALLKKRLIEIESENEQNK